MEFGDSLSVYSLFTSGRPDVELILPAMKCLKTANAYILRCSLRHCVISGESLMLAVIDGWSVDFRLTGIIFDLRSRPYPRA